MMYLARLKSLLSHKLLSNYSNLQKI